MSKQSELRSLLETIFVVVGSFVGAIIIITLATSKPEPADTSSMVVENEPMEANVQPVAVVKVAEKSDMKKNSSVISGEKIAQANCVLCHGSE